MNPAKNEFLLNKEAKSILKLFTFDSETKLPCIIVVPGGGYDHFGLKEQETVVEKFLSLGFAAALLHYTLSPMKFPDSLTDLALAVQLLRENSEKYNLNKKIFLCGFSAGGHLSATLGCYWNNSELISFINSSYGTALSSSQIKPDGFCLCYPVISADKSICHEGSITALTGNLSQKNAELLCSITNSQTKRDIVSIEKHITECFPPAFVWHTREDTAVVPANTLRLIEQLDKNKVPYEYHLYGSGSHGLALAEETEAEHWPELFRAWILKLK